MSTLYVVATPIGNLSDLSDRAKNILSSVSVVLAEDTRRTKQLLNYLNVHPKLISYHQHSSENKLTSILNELPNMDTALVTDAGTPGVSDPGGILIQEAVKRFGGLLTIVPVPGPSALIVAASISGFPMDEFVFLGYPPHKKGRKTFFDRLAGITSPAIFYEAPYRIIKAINEIALREPDRLIVVCRELTKKFESIYRGDARSVLTKLESEPARGEYVVVVGQRSNFLN